MNDVVIKHWGHERLVHQSATGYMVKQITMHSGKSCSWHSHNEKEETATVLRGTLVVETMDNGRHILQVGDSMTISKGRVHRMLADFGTATYIESSNIDFQATRKQGFKPQHFSAAHATGMPAVAYAVGEGRPVVNSVEIFAMGAASIWAPTMPVTTGDEGGDGYIYGPPDKMMKIGESEYTYLSKGKVGKWFRDAGRALAVYERMSIHPRGPRDVCLSPDGHWVSYAEVAGTDWPRDQTLDLWAGYWATIVGEPDWHWPARADRGWSEWFLQERTFRRLATYRPGSIIWVKKWAGWKRLLASGGRITPLWHGDLGHENVIFGEVGAWIDLHEMYEGDVHYDAAKLIKSCEFWHSDVSLHYPESSAAKAALYDEYEKVGLDVQRVRDCLVVVYLKMAGAHGGTLGSEFEKRARELME